MLVTCAAEDMKRGCTIYNYLPARVYITDLCNFIGFLQQTICNKARTITGIHIFCFMILTREKGKTHNNDCQSDVQS